MNDVMLMSLYRTLNDELACFKGVGDSFPHFERWVKNNKEDIIDASWEDLIGLGVTYISPTGLFKAKNLKIMIDSGKLND